MAAEWTPAFIGADVEPCMTFETRVRWYAIWIKAYPLSTIHFRHKALPTHDGKGCRGFIAEAQSQWSPT